MTSDTGHDGAPPRRATLKDVARLAGVSPMTVSNVINGTGRGYRAETLARVMRAVADANYRPDVAARSLRTSRHMSVGMLVMRAGPRFLADPYITNLIDGLCSGLNRRGYSLVLQGLLPEEIGAAPLVRQRQTDALCVLMPGAFASDPVVRPALLALNQPVILFQQFGALPEGDICFVRQDDFEGGQALCRHVLERGARDLVVLIPQLDWPAMLERVGGIRAHAAAAAPATPASVTVVTSADESPLAAQAALDAHLAAGGRPDAVLAGNDQMAVGAWRLLRRRGLRVPQDVRLTGFNGFDFLDLLPERLTTVQSPAMKLGELGAHHIVRRVETGAFESGTVVLPVTLMPGETT